MIILLDEFSNDKEKVKINFDDYDEIIFIHNGSKYSSKTKSVLHNNIKINETHPTVKRNLKKAYKIFTNILNLQSILIIQNFINFYNRK